MKNGSSLPSLENRLVGVTLSSPQTRWRIVHSGIQ